MPPLNSGEVISPFDVKTQRLPKKDHLLPFKKVIKHVPILTAGILGINEFNNYISGKEVNEGALAFFVAIIVFTYLGRHLTGENGETREYNSVIDLGDGEDGWE